VFCAGRAQQVSALAVEQDQGAEVDVELKVDALGDRLGDRSADADTRVVDEHVEPAPAVAVGGDDALDLGLVGQVGGDVLDVEPVAAQRFRRLGELLRPARRQRQPMALLAEHAGDREPDPARGSGDEGSAFRHGESDL
jgi:hypothetical protein